MQIAAARRRASQTSNSSRPLAVVTGASSGIGFELATQCASNGFDLVLAADEPLDEAVVACRQLGASVDAVNTDLATLPGVDSLVSRIGGRPVEALLANAGHGLGQAFLDQDFDEIQHVVDTNITGTMCPIHRLGSAMRARGRPYDPAEVAKDGFDAMMRGDADIVSGWKNKVQTTVANVTPNEMLAEQHRKMAEPGTGKR